MHDDCIEEWIIVVDYDVARLSTESSGLCYEIVRVGIQNVQVPLLSWVEESVYVVVSAVALTSSHVKNWTG